MASEHALLWFALGFVATVALYWFFFQWFSPIDSQVAAMGFSSGFLGAIWGIIVGLGYEAKEDKKRGK